MMCLHTGLTYHKLRCWRVTQRGLAVVAWTRACRIWRPWQPTSPSRQTHPLCRGRCWPVRTVARLPTPPPLFRACQPPMKCGPLPCHGTELGSRKNTKDMLCVFSCSVSYVSCIGLIVKMKSILKYCESILYVNL